MSSDVTEKRGSIFLSKYMIEAMRPELLENLKREMNVRDVDIDIGEGLVCLSCGNRGYDIPFAINGYGKFVVKANSQGVLGFTITDDQIRETIKSQMDESLVNYGVFGRGSFVSSNRNIAVCMNCGGPVQPLSVALDNCYDNGCSGCPVCGIPTDEDIVLEACTECPVPRLFASIAEPDFKATDEHPVPDYRMDSETEADFTQECANWECSALPARVNIYGITLERIYSEMKKNNIKAEQEK